MRSIRFCALFAANRKLDFERFTISEIAQYPANAVSVLVPDPIQYEAVGRQYFDAILRFNGLQWPDPCIELLRRQLMLKLLDALLPNRIFHRVGSFYVLSVTVSWMSVPACPKLIHKPGWMR